MLTKIFSTAVLLVVSWQTVVNTHIRKDVQTLQNDLHQIQSFIRQDMSSIGHSNQQATNRINDNLESYVALQERNLSTSSNLEAEAKNLKSQLKSNDKQVKKLNDISALNRAYADVLQAEIFGLRKNGEAASKTLLGSKKAIYKASSTFPKHKDTLRKLMGPIDALAGKWKRGDFSGTSLEIRRKLRAVLDGSST